MANRKKNVKSKQVSKRKSITGVRKKYKLPEITMILLVADSLANNKSVASIKQHCSQNGYDGRSSPTIIRKARLVLRNNILKTKLEHYEQTLNSLDVLYQINMEGMEPDLKECRAILEQKNKIFIAYQNSLMFESDL